jgi:hypothetical protein
MLRIRNLSNVFQKRLIRPLYAHTQATPYAAYLDPDLRDETGAFVAPTGAFTHQNGIVPGTVMVRTEGEAVTVAKGAAGEQPFGLLANFVGGTIDDLQDENQVGVWRGPDAVFELLKPAFDPALQSVAITSGQAIPLYTGANGLLTATAGTADKVVAHLITKDPAKITIDLKV